MYPKPGSLDSEFLHGLPGVGKLTVARELAHLTGYRVFHNHLTVDLVEAMFEFGTTPFVQLRESIWLSVFRQTVKAELPGLIFTFVFESTVRDYFLSDVLDVIAPGGGSVLFVELKCHQEELERRLVDPSRRKFGKLSDVEILRRSIREGKYTTPENFKQNLVIDTTALEPEETARRIVDHYRLEIDCE